MSSSQTHSRGLDSSVFAFFGKIKITKINMTEYITKTKYINKNRTKYITKLNIQLKIELNT